MYSYIFICICICVIHTHVYMPLVETLRLKQLLNFNLKMLIAEEDIFRKRLISLKI